jgi:hypothetical protein
MIQEMIDAMQQEVVRHGFELMQRYPRDLLVHDRAILTQYAKPGAVIAWVIGHCHSQAVAVGIHEMEHSVLTTLAKQSRADQFYRLDCAADGFELTAIARDEYLALSNTPIPYRATRNPKNFILSRNGFAVGHCQITPPDYRVSQDRIHTLELTPTRNASPLDLAALECYGRQALRKIEDCFAHLEIVWHPTNDECSASTLAA